MFCRGSASSSTNGRSESCSWSPPRSTLFLSYWLESRNFSRCWRIGDGVYPRAQRRATGSRLLVTPQSLPDGLVLTKAVCTGNGAASVTFTNYGTAAVSGSLSFSYEVIK